MPLIMGSALTICILNAGIYDYICMYMTAYGYMPHNRLAGNFLIVEILLTNGKFMFLTYVQKKKKKKKKKKKPKKKKKYILK